MDSFRWLNLSKCDLTNQQDVWRKADKTLKLICGYPRVLFQNENLATTCSLMQSSFTIKHHRCILGTEYVAANKTDKSSYSYGARWRKQVINIGFFFKEVLSFIFHQAVPSVVKYTHLKHTAQLSFTCIYNATATQIKTISSFPGFLVLPLSKGNNFHR